MNFEETEWYKQFGPCEYKITLNNGQVIKSEKWRDYDKVEFNKTEFTFSDPGSTVDPHRRDSPRISFG